MAGQGTKEGRREVKWEGKKQECPRIFSFRGNSPEKSDQEVVNCPLKISPYACDLPRKGPAVSWFSSTLGTQMEKGFLPLWELPLSTPHLTLASLGKTVAKMALRQRS